MNRKTEKNNKQTSIPSASVSKTRELITPELAKHYLTFNANNRPMVLNHVAELAEDMKSGRWRETHQGLAFGEDGRLYDGQHRLMAVVKSSVPVWMDVTRGLSKEALDVIDIGNTRRAHDIVAITDGVRDNRCTRASIIVAHSLSTYGKLLWVRTPKYGARMLRDANARHRESVLAILSALSTTHDRLSQAALIGSLAVCHHTEPAKALEFTRMLRSIRDGATCSPVLALYQYVTMRYASGGGTAREELSLRTFGAFDAFMRNAEVKQLKRNHAAREKYLSPWPRPHSDDNDE